MEPHEVHIKQDEALPKRSNSRAWHSLAQGALTAATLALTTLTMNTGAWAENLVVGIDKSRTLQLSGEASTVVVGNPMIADAHLAERNLAVIVGRTFGQTTLLAIDAEGKVITNTSITVGDRNHAGVNLYRGNSRVSLSCAPECREPFITGDDNEHTRMINEQIANRINRAKDSTNPEKDD